jgi:hypothetical protein
MVLILLSALATAEQSKVSLSLGFGGWSVPTRWTPLWVSVLPPPARGRVEVETLPRSSPAGGAESFRLGPDGSAECPVYLDQGIDAIRVRVMDGNAVISTETILPWAKSFPGHIVLTCGLSAPAQKALGGFLFPYEPVQVAIARKAEFPSVPIDYDGVAAVVMDGDEVSLSPAQREAMRYFLSGGGRLVLFGQRPERFAAPGTDLLAASIQAGQGGEDLVKARLGLGLVCAAPRPSASTARARTAEFWAEALELGGFETAKRATASAFSRIRALLAELGDPEAGGEAPLPQRPWTGPWIFSACFAAASLLLFLPKKRRLAAYGLFAAISLAAAFLAGARIDAAWRRGTASDARLLVLPNGGGILADFQTRRDIPAESASDGTTMPRGAAITFDRVERGTMDPVVPFIWRHDLRLPYLSVLRAERDRVQLSGVLPAVALSGAVASAGSSAGPQGLAADPFYASLNAGERTWIRSVMDAFPGWGFRMSTGRAPALGYSAQGGAPARILWIEPIARAASMGGK